MAVIPSWISVNPKDFVEAAQGGARIGTELAGQANEYNIAASRNATAIQEAQMRANTEAAAQQAAGERAQQEAAIRRWELTQQIAHQQNQIAAENERNQNTIAGENTRAASSLAAMAPYHTGMLNARNEENRIAQEREEREKNKADVGPLPTATLPSVKAHQSFDVTPAPEKVSDSKFFSPSTWGSSHSITLPPFTTTNTNSIPEGATVVTNEIPTTPSLSWKVAPGQNPSIPPITPSPMLLLSTASQNSRVKVTDPNGKLVTVPQEQLQDALSQGYKEVQ